MSDPLFSAFLLLLAALVLGLQHGVDWDHVAAITDITASVPGVRRGFLLGSLYALGHAAVILTLGILAIVVGFELPNWIDGLLEPFVGATLILLAAYIVVSLLRGDQDLRFRSRWMLLYDGLRTIWAWLTGRLRGAPTPSAVRSQTNYGVRTAIGVGMVHGIGAETPSQVLLFLAAAGAGGHGLGIAVLLTFVLGLLITNSAIVVASLFGYRAVRNNRRLMTGAGVVTAGFSVVIGLLFLTGQASLLPPIIGG